MTQLQIVKSIGIDTTAAPENGRRRRFANFRHWAIARVIIYLAAVIGALVLSKLLTMPFIPPAPSPLHAPLQLTANLCSAALLLCAYALAVRVMERRGATEVGPRLGWSRLLIGCGVGSVLMATIFLMLWGLGLATFTTGSGVHGLAGILVAFLAVAVLEELVLRAIVFRVVEEAAGTTAALLSSAALFGALHGLNPGATLLSSGAIAIEGGLLLALAFAVTRSLWMTIGIHMSWNFFQGAVFGADVSGFPPSRSFLLTTLKGPHLLTGGAFGPEASVLSVGVCSIAVVIFGVLLARQSGWRPRAFRLRLA